jgi:hypothetical protein
MHEDADDIRQETAALGTDAIEGQQSGGGADGGIEFRQGKEALWRSAATCAQ